MASTCNRGTQLPPSSKINLSDEVEIAGWEVVGEDTSDSAAKGRSVFSESDGVEDPLDVSKTSGPGNLWYQAPFVHVSLPAMLVNAILRFDCHICD